MCDRITPADMERCARDSVAEGLTDYTDYVSMPFHYGYRVGEFAGFKGAPLADFLDDPADAINQTEERRKARKRELRAAKWQRQKALRLVPRACAVCGNSFTPTCGNQKICPGVCKLTARRKKARDWATRARAARR